MDKIETLLRGFINELNTGLKYKIIPAGEESIYNYECNVYNEISLQHELGKYLEKNLEPDYKIFFEKNIFAEEKKKDEFVKTEIDLVIVNINNVNEKYAIELKFFKGENARTPENLYDFIKDIRFMEDVKKFKNYTNTFNFAIANSQKYYKYELNKNKYLNNNKYDIYEMFRIKPDEKNNRKYKIPKNPENDIHQYCKPTGEEEGKVFKLDKSYTGNWEILNSDEYDDTKIFQYRFILINHNDNDKKC